MTPEQQKKHMKTVQKEKAKRLKNIHKRRKEIKRIKVARGTQKFWVTNKKKMKYYLDMPKRMLLINIIDVEYKTPEELEDEQPKEKH